MEVNVVHDLVRYATIVLEDVEVGGTDRLRDLLRYGLDSCTTS